MPVAFIFLKFRGEGSRARGMNPTNSPLSSATDPIYHSTQIMHGFLMASISPSTVCLKMFALHIWVIALVFGKVFQISG